MKKTVKTGEYLTKLQAKTRLFRALSLSFSSVLARRAKCNMHDKFGGDRLCNFRDICKRTDKQRNRHTFTILRMTMRMGFQMGMEIPCESHWEWERVGMYVAWNGNNSYSPWEKSHGFVKGGSVAESLACWTQAQKGLGSNRSRDAVG